MNNFNELKYRFNYANPALKLVFINAAVFLVALLINLFAYLFFGQRELLSSFLSLPSNWHAIGHRPWTVITYQFSHFGALHFLFNMLVLYFAGNIFTDFFRKNDAYKVYIYGGIVAALFFVLASNYIPVFKGQEYTLLGASGSVMALLFAVTLYAPNIRVYLFGSFQVKLKWIAVAYFILDLLAISDSNAGGHIAHIGGAVFGLLFALYRQGNLGWTKPPQTNKYQSRNLKVEVNAQAEPLKGKQNATRKAAPTQEEIDAILDKISKSGYDRLSKEEKDILFKASQE